MTSIDLRRVLQLDPFQLARWQLQLDRARTRPFPWLLPVKIDRMRASPLAFLRGAAPLFYHILSLKPGLTGGPAGEGWITGDLHVENFGAYRWDGSEAHHVTFNLNDFDEAIVGPWKLDLLRLITSMVLAARDLGSSGSRILDACTSAIRAYAGTAVEGAKPPKAPGIVRRLVEHVEARTREELLAARTKWTGGTRRFIRGPRYRNLPRSLHQEALRAFAAYAGRLPAEARPEASSLDVLDAAFRIAGTGSLGVLRVAMLTRGKGGKDGAWLFDMKEEGIPSPSILCGEPKLQPASRVIDGLRACIEHPPRMIGSTRLQGRSMFVRRLAPQEDRVDLRRLPPDELPEVASYLAALAGAAHRGGASKLPRRWLNRDRDQLVDSALLMAGLHEASYLAFCRLTQAIGRS